MASSSKNNSCWKNPALYKTRLCDYFSAGRPCKFGLNCWYAHGPIELRTVTHLENDPVAKSISLAEVLQILPPSKDRTNAMNQANELMYSSQSDVFQRFTIPFLNSCAMRLMSEQKTKAEEGDSVALSSLASDLLPVLKQLNGNTQQGVSAQSSPQSTETAVQEHLPRPVKAKITNKASPPMSRFPPPVFNNEGSALILSRDSSGSSIGSVGSRLLSSSHSVSSNSPRLFTNTLPAAPTTSAEDEVEKQAFDDVYQRFNDECSNYFI